MFDLSVVKILILGVLGLVIFGPEQLPRIAAQAGRALRDLRRLADNARADLTESLGPEFRDFDFQDLNPKAFMRKHLLDDLDDDGSRWAAAGSSQGNGEMAQPGQPASLLVPGELPPYDTDAT